LQGHEPFVSYEGLEQLHRFLFILGFTHVLYSFVTVVLSMIKVCLPYSLLIRHIHAVSTFLCIIVGDCFRYIAGGSGKPKHVHSPWSSCNVRSSEIGCSLGHIVVSVIHQLNNVALLTCCTWEVFLSLSAKRKIMRRQSTFVFHHASHPWSKSKILLWMVGSLQCWSFTDSCCILFCVSLLDANNLKRACFIFPVNFIISNFTLQMYWIFIEN
jgi:hypothetical protein